MTVPLGGKTFYWIYITPINWQLAFYLDLFSTFTTNQNFCLLNIYFQPF